MSWHLYEAVSWKLFLNMDISTSVRLIFINICFKTPPTPPKKIIIKKRLKLDELFICDSGVFLSKNCKAYQELSLYFFFQAETSSETKLHMLLVESRKMAENLSHQKSAPDELMQV